VFTVRDPVVRTIAALPFEDRVVQHALMGFVAPRIERSLVAQTWACLPERGSNRDARSVGVARVAGCMGIESGCAVGGGRTRGGLHGDWTGMRGRWGSHAWRGAIPADGGNPPGDARVCARLRPPGGGARKGKRRVGPRDGVNPPNRDEARGLWGVVPTRRSRPDRPRACVLPCDV
jgi:hypothetical protein